MKESKKKEPRGLRAISIAIHKVSPRKKNNNKKMKDAGNSGDFIDVAIKKPDTLRKALRLEKEEDVPAKKLKGTSIKKGRKRTRAASTLRKLNKKRKTTRKYR